MNTFEDFEKEVSRIRSLVDQIEVKGETNLVAMIMILQSCERLSKGIRNAIDTVNQPKQYQNGSDADVQTQQPEP